MVLKGARYAAKSLVTLDNALTKENSIRIGIASSTPDAAAACLPGRAAIVLRLLCATMAVLVDSEIGNVLLLGVQQIDVNLTSIVHVLV